MSIKQRCLVCGHSEWQDLRKDLATGFVFCQPCLEKVQDRYDSLIGERCLATWLVAIARVLNER